MTSKFKPDHHRENYAFVEWYTANAMVLLTEHLDNLSISRTAIGNWPSKSCDFLPLGYLGSITSKKVYIPIIHQTILKLEQPIVWECKERF